VIECYVMKKNVLLLALGATYHFVVGAKMKMEIVRIAVMKRMEQVMKMNKKKK